MSDNKSSSSTTGSGKKKAAAAPVFKPVSKPKAKKKSQALTEGKLKAAKSVTPAFKKRTSTRTRKGNLKKEDMIQKPDFGALPEQQPLSEKVLAMDNQQVQAKVQAKLQSDAAKNIRKAISSTTSGGKKKSGSTSSTKKLLRKHRTGDFDSDSDDSLDGPRSSTKKKLIKEVPKQDFQTIVEGENSDFDFDDDDRLADLFDQSDATQPLTFPMEHLEITASLPMITNNLTSKPFLLQLPTELPMPNHFDRLKTPFSTNRAMKDETAAKTVDNSSKTTQSSGGGAGSLMHDIPSSQARLPVSQTRVDLSEFDDEIGQSLWECMTVHCTAPSIVQAESEARTLAGYADTSTQSNANRGADNDSDVASHAVKKSLLSNNAKDVRKRMDPHGVLPKNILDNVWFEYDLAGKLGVIKDFEDGRVEWHVSGRVYDIKRGVTPPFLQHLMWGGARAGYADLVDVDNSEAVCESVDLGKVHDTLVVTPNIEHLLKSIENQHRRRATNLDEVVNLDQ